MRILKSVYQAATIELAVHNLDKAKGKCKDKYSSRIK